MKSIYCLLLIFLIVNQSFTISVSKRLKQMKKKIHKHSKQQVRNSHRNPDSPKEIKERLKTYSWAMSNALGQNINKEQGRNVVSTTIVNKVSECFQKGLRPYFQKNAIDNPVDSKKGVNQAMMQCFKIFETIIHYDVKDQIKDLAINAGKGMINGVAKKHFYTGILLVAAIIPIPGTVAVVGLGIALYEIYNTIKDFFSTPAEELYETLTNCWDNDSIWQSNKKDNDCTSRGIDGAQKLVIVLDRLMSNSQIGGFISKGVDMVTRFQKKKHSTNPRLMKKDKKVQKEIMKEVNQELKERQEKQAKIDEEAKKQRQQYF